MPVAFNAAAAFEEGGSFKYYTLARAVYLIGYMLSGYIYFIGFYVTKTAVARAVDGQSLLIACSSSAQAVDLH